MSIVQTVERGVDHGRSLGADLSRRLFVPASLVVSAMAVFAAAVVSLWIWRLMPYAQPSSIELHLRFGLGAGLIVALLTVVRNEHRLAFHAAGEVTPTRILQLWNMAFAALFVVAFLTKRAEELSRGTVVLFYLSGFVALWLSRSLTTRAIQSAARARFLVGERALVVGTEAGIADFLTRHRPWELGIDVVGAVPVGPATPSEAGLGRYDLSRATELARDLGVREVFIAVPWSDTRTIELCLEAFLTTPVAIHLAPERILDRFDRVAIARVGAMASLELTRPMSLAGATAKRVFDLVVALAGLILLMPLLALVALLIRLDSPGPSFFFQSRYGFNQSRFRIVKFRTMTTPSGDPDFVQAARGDRRVTRIGRILRASNIDELPQLLNVLAGHMSLVGPRPHAVPHNRAFERRIALYARRHNVRPGITGWAQVNGLRGETDTDEKMSRRVEHDLFYIDNWSMLFDLRILVRTLLSRRAYRNAY